MKQPVSTPSVRLLRVGESLRHALAAALLKGDVHDAALVGISVTVSEIRLSSDLRHAYAYVMPLGGGDHRPVLDALNRAAPYLQTQISKGVRLKYTPKLRFRLDESFDEATHINQLLADPRVKRDLGDPED